MIKKLKKVDGLQAERQKLIDSVQANLNNKLQALNDAYKNNNGLGVDKATNELFKLLEPIKDITSFYTEMKNHTWQKNHLKIIASISNLMQEKNRMPTNTEISIAAGLSEETTYKHLREFKDHDLARHEADKFQLMKDRVLTTVFNLGVQGDIRACKVYLDYFSSNNVKQQPESLQTNYIQINNLKITPEELEQLPPATLQKIETLIKLPVKKTSVKRP